MVAATEQQETFPTEEEETGNVSVVKAMDSTISVKKQGQNEANAVSLKKPKSKRKPKTFTQIEEDPELPTQLPPECCEGFREGDDHHKKGGRDRDAMRNPMSVPWFQKINMPPEQYKHLCFAESLLMVDEVGNVAGKMYTTVTPAKWGDKQCLCIHSGSYGTPEPDSGLQCGTTITGFVSFDMKTLQEFVHEWAVMDGKIKERKTFIMKEDDMMLIQIQLIIDGNTAEQKSFTLGRLQQHLLVTESAHILLLRLLMWEKRVVGVMELKTIAFTGAVVKNKYTEMGNGWENVKGEEVRTWSIRRTVEFDFGERIWDSMLNKFGRLVLRCQPENPMGLIPLWFEPVHKKEKGRYPPYIWACDAEDELAAEYRCYLLEHPELRALISDFTQAVLLRKPTQIIPFAQQHFESFLKTVPSSHQTSSVTYSSSSEVSSSYYLGEWGEWAGESRETNFRLYPIRPTRSLDGLEKVSSEEELLDQVFNTEAEEDQVTVSDGAYVVKPNP